MATLSQSLPWFSHHLVTIKGATVSDKLQDRTMAFAGICQAAYLVQKVARDGSCDEAALCESLSSILVTDPAHPLEVYNNTHLAIRDGYHALVTQLGANNNPNNVELTRYVVSLIALERKLAKRKEVLHQLSDRIGQIERQLQHFNLLDEQILANLASIYSDLISPVGPRIQVTGTPLFLQQSIVQHKVRALLLAGIRAAVLWRQLGGSRTQLLFSRKKMIELAKRF